MTFSGLSDEGKVVAGLTILRDPITGQFFDVEQVWSGAEIITSADYHRGSTSERSALYGASTSRSREARQREIGRLNHVRTGQL